MRIKWTKEKVFEQIMKASCYDMLGLFVGSGFSKAVLDGNREYKAYSWDELLKECCDRFEVESTRVDKKGTYPEKASYICHEIAKNKKISYEEAEMLLKEEICKLTTVYLNEDVREQYRAYFDVIKPTWVTTTNYDLNIESVLGGRACTIAPNNMYVKTNKTIPVYHIHGVCSSPKGIVITNKDYAELFRPGEYRYSRLPFLLKESLVLFMGYSLNDLNVLSAIDYSQNVYANSLDAYELPIIQLCYCDNPKDEPYRGENGIIIYEIESIESFFEEYINYKKSNGDVWENGEEKVDEYIQWFSDFTKSKIEQYLMNQNGIRDDLIASVRRSGEFFGYVYDSFFLFVSAVLNECDNKSCESGNFYAYKEKLELICEILKNIPVEKIPTWIFGYLAKNLIDVYEYVGDSMGQSWVAKSYWENNKKSIPEDTVRKLLGYIERANVLAWDLKGELKALLDEKQEREV